MSVKKLMIQLEKDTNFKYLQFEAKFCSNRKTFYVHMGLKNALFSYLSYKELLEAIKAFIDEHLPEEFNFYQMPKFINSSKWKLGYVICRKKIN